MLGAGIDYLLFILGFRVALPFWSPFDHRQIAAFLVIRLVEMIRQIFLHTSALKGNGGSQNMGI